jgi:hypothetical protein
MRRIQQAVERPMAALTATVTSGDALPMLMALSQPFSIPSAIGLMALSAWSARPRGAASATDADLDADAA